MPGARHLKKSRLSAMRAQSLSEASATANVKIALREAGYHAETGDELLAVVDHLIMLTRGGPIPPDLGNRFAPTAPSRPTVIAPPVQPTRMIPPRAPPQPMTSPRTVPRVPPGVQIPRQPPAPQPAAPQAADFDFDGDETADDGLEPIPDDGRAPTPDMTDPAVFARVAQEKIAANLAKSEREGIKIRAPGLGGGLPGAVPPSERPTRQRMSIDEQRKALESVTGHAYIPPDASGGNPNMKPPGGGPGPRGAR